MSSMKQTTLHTLRGGMLVLACLVASSTGCTSGTSHWKFASWDVRRAVGLKKGEDKPDPEIPVRLVSTWSEAVLNRTGETSKRGFGGRLAFFKGDSQDPVRVNGQLVIYAFDETTRPQYETQPTRRYVFPAEQLAIYESDSKLGPSYSVWLPWDEAGGPGRKISLIARFEPKGGPVIVGEQTKHYLAGPSEGPPNGSQPQLADAPIPQGVQTASYQSQTVGAAGQATSMGAPMQTAGATPRETSILKDANRMDTTTIALPRKLSSTPGAPLYESRAAAQRAFETPHMPGVPQAGVAGAAMPTTAPPTMAPQMTSGATLQPSATSTTPTAVTATAAYLQPPGLPLAHQRPGGYQSTQPLAQAIPAAR
jgi:hypothetical protein